MSSVFNGHKILEEYNPDDVSLAFVCSHSFLQRGLGGYDEGFQTLMQAKKEGGSVIGIAIGEPPKYHKAFPYSQPNEYIVVKDYEELKDSDFANQLVERQAVVVPDGSIVEYFGSENFAKAEFPTFGNRRSLEWEADRLKQREWLESAGVRMPKTIKSPEDIEKPVFVKYYGAKGGRGAFVARNTTDFYRQIDPEALDTGEFIIQEYIFGVRYYPHMFFTPLIRGYYDVGDGSLELLAADRRDEANIDECYRAGSMEALTDAGRQFSFVVTGNTPCVLRESLLSIIFDYTEKAILRSQELFGGLTGPISLEGVMDETGKFFVIEATNRIAAGSTVNAPVGDIYSWGRWGEPMSMGRRIAREIRIAQQQEDPMAALKKIIT